MKKPPHVTYRRTDSLAAEVTASLPLSPKTRRLKEHNGTTVTLRPNSSIIGGDTEYGAYKIFFENHSLRAYKSGETLDMDNPYIRVYIRRQKVDGKYMLEITGDDPGDVLLAIRLLEAANRPVRSFR